MTMITTPGDDIMKFDISNKALLAQVDKKVYGHTKAKKILINAINRSRMRYYQKWGLMLKGSELLKLNNVLLIGQSGTGKTYLVETIAELCNMPMVTIDATQLCPASAHGITAEGLEKRIALKISDFIENSRSSIGFSQKGVADLMIVYIDEFDKLGLKTSEDWNKQTQSSLLRLLENKGTYKGITFILSGAFHEETVEKDIKKSKGIGFFSENKEEESNDSLTELVMRNGILPEIAGRMSHIVKLDELSLDDYQNILRNIILVDKQKELSAYNIENFSLSDEEITDIATKAKKSKLGVRALNNIISDLLIELEFNHEEMPLLLTQSEL